MRIISIRGTNYKVDDQDYAWISAINWHIGLYGYAKWRDNKKKITYFMHRLIAKPGGGMTVDHINGDVYDNTRANLRICTLKQNSYNVKKQQFTSSKYKGVAYHAGSKKWQAKITKDGKQYHLGFFENEKDAAKIYDIQAKELFGEYARLNF